jgi:hypothetical protein
MNVSMARLVLKGALDRIRRFGWIQEDNGSERIGYCLIGALGASAGSFSSLAGSMRYADAERAIISVIGTDYLASWNDTAGRTRSEVESMLMQAISSLKERA